MAVKNTNPYQPPDEWVEILMKLPQLELPRVVVAMSAGRGSYKPIIDVKPKVTRVVRDEGNEQRDVVTVHLAEDYVDGDCRDAAETLYAEACAKFLDTRRGDGSNFVRQGRLRLQLFEGASEVGSHSLEVAREAFGVMDDIVQLGTNTADSVLRVIADHSKTVGQQFLALAKQQGEQATSERAGILDYARGALELTKEAGEYRAAAALQLAEGANGGFWSSESGTMLTVTLVESVPKAFDLLDKLVSARKADAEARRAEAEARAAEHRNGGKP